MQIKNIEKIEILLFFKFSTFFSLPGLCIQTKNIENRLEITSDFYRKLILMGPLAACSRSNN